MNGARRQRLVVGLGNTLRGDDALGALVIRELSPLVDPDSVQLLQCAAVTPELAATLAAVDLVVFIDASRNGPIGQVEYRQLESETGGLPFTHGCGIAALPQLVRQLYGHAPTAYLLTVRGGSFDLQDGRLTPEMEAMVRPIVEKTLALLDDDGRDR